MIKCAWLEDLNPSESLLPFRIAQENLGQEKGNFEGILQLFIQLFASKVASFGEQKNVLNAENDNSSFVQTGSQTNSNNSNVSLEGIERLGGLNSSGLEVKIEGDTQKEVLLEALNILLTKDEELKNTDIKPLWKELQKEFSSREEIEVSENIDAILLEIIKFLSSNGQNIMEKAEITSIADIEKTEGFFENGSLKEVISQIRALLSEKESNLVGQEKNIRTDFQLNIPANAKSAKTKPKNFEHRTSVNSNIKRPEKNTDFPVSALKIEKSDFENPRMKDAEFKKVINLLSEKNKDRQELSEQAPLQSEGSKNQGSEKNLDRFQLNVEKAIINKIDGPEKANKIKVGEKSVKGLESKEELKGKTSDFVIHQDLKTNSGSLVSKRDMGMTGRTVKFNKTEVIDQIAKKIEVQVKEGKHEISIQLKPKVLGELRIKVGMENGSLKIHFIATTHVAKEILESDLHALRQALGGQGLQVGEFTVALGDDRTAHTRDGKKRGAHSLFSKRQKEREISPIYPSVEKRITFYTKGEIDFWV